MFRRERRARRFAYNLLSHDRTVPDAASRHHRCARPADRQHRQAAVHDRPPERDRSCGCPAPTSRACTPRSPPRTAHCIIRDKQSRFGTFVNGEKIAERVLAHGDQIRLGQAGDTEIVFFVDDEAPSVEKSAVSAAGELRQMAALLDGLARARLGPRARRSAGDGARLGDRGHRRRARLHHAGRSREAPRVQAGARARQGHAVRHAPSRPAARFRKRCSPPASRPSSRTCSTATSRSSTPAPSRSASARCCARRCGWFATSSAPTQRGAEEIIGVLYLDSRERGRAAVRLGARSALETLSAEAALAIENARLYREALDKAKFEQELKVAAAIQQSLLPVAHARGGVLLDGRGVARVPRRRRRLLTTTSICPPGSSASSSATSRARDRRPRCSRRPCSACSAPKRRIRRSAAALVTPSQPRVVPARHRRPVS